MMATIIESVLSDMLSRSIFEEETRPSDVNVRIIIL
jgi:hypothetical protein